MEVKGFEDLEVYQMSFQIGRLVWNIFKNMTSELRFTVGSQMLRSGDSVGANIAEGFGRYYYKDALRFYYNARGSLYELKHWLKIVKDRRLITDQMSEEILEKIDLLSIRLNSFINNQRSNVNKPITNH